MGAFLDMTGISATSTTVTAPVRTDGTAKTEQPLQSDSATGGRVVRDLLDLSPEARGTAEQDRDQKSTLLKIDLSKLAVNGELAQKVREQVEPAKLAQALRKLSDEIRDTMELFRHRISLVDNEARSILQMAPDERSWWKPRRQQRINTLV